MFRPNAIQELDRHALARFRDERAPAGPRERAAELAAERAARDSRPALTVLLSTSALPGREVFARQRADDLRRRGATEEAASAVYEQLLRFADFLATDRENRPHFEAIALDFLAAHGVPKEDLDPKLAQSLLDGFLKAPWYWYFVSHDPRVALRRIDSPVFTVLAGMDENIAWREHLAALAQAIGPGAERVEGGGPSGARGGPGEAELTAVVLPDQDHFFLEYEGRRLEKHVPEKMEIATELYEVLDAELSRRGLVKDVCPAGR